MINPSAPMISGKDVDEMLEYYADHKFDTLVPIREEQLHAFNNGKPVNFNKEIPLGSLCDAGSSLQICTWTICIWKAEIFKKAYEETGRAIFSGDVGFFPQNIVKSLNIKNEDDFIMAEVLAKNEYRWRINPVRYDSQIENPANPAMWLSEMACVEKILLEMAEKKDHLNLIEWGSGGSTIYFSNFLREKDISFTWHAIENFIPWYHRVVDMIEESGLGETTHVYLTDATCDERKEVQELLDLEDYINYPAKFDVKFDFLLIDARRRKTCMEIAKNFLSDVGYVVLHDAERADCIPLFDLYDGGYINEVESPVPGGVQKLWAGQLKK